MVIRFNHIWRRVAVISSWMFRIQVIGKEVWEGLWEGVWERQIGTTRSILNNILNYFKGRLDTSSPHTFFYGVMAIINSRPLTCQTLNDPKSLEPITPNHLLTMKNKIIFPPPGNFVREDIYARTRRRKVQYLAEQFWGKWREEYLLRQKWSVPKRNLKIGDIVIVQHETSRNEWPFGKNQAQNQAESRIKSESKSESRGQNQSEVRIKLGVKSSEKERNNSQLSIIERPIQKVVLLLEGADPNYGSFESFTVAPLSVISWNYSWSCESSLR